jgi:enoyl-CoA hydratase/carnithine racemase
VAGDGDVRAVVLQSDDPDFFIAHADVDPKRGEPLVRPHW